MDYEKMKKCRMIRIRDNHPIIDVILNSKFRNHSTTFHYEDVGIVWPQNEFFEELKKERNLPIKQGEIYLIISDEKRFLLAKIKYGL